MESLAHPLNSYKVILNAEENQLSGCGLKTDAFALVIVEGARKAVARYNKLMLRRMNWKLRREPRDGDAQEEDGGGVAAEDDAEARRQREEEEEGRAEANKCTLVWQGAVLKPAFKRFKYEPIRSAAVRFSCAVACTCHVIADALTRDDAPPAGRRQVPRGHGAAQLLGPGCCGRLHRVM